MTSSKFKKIVDSPDQWIITRKGDFVRINDSEIRIDKKLEIIRQKLSSSGRFKGKTPEQTSKERYDKVLEEVDFDYNKLHDWLYNEKNKDKVEIIKESNFSYHDSLEIHKAIDKFVRGTKEKWRFRSIGKSSSYFSETLVNEETGQVFYLPGGISGLSMVYKQSLWISGPKILKPKEKHTATLIFLHGTYGAGSLDQMAEKFLGLKIIHPYSPTIQYDMWHGSQPAPGGQCQGWINITGDAWEIMEGDVCLNNPSRINYEEVDQSIHLDYPQLRRAANYINELIEREIIVEGIPPERIFVAGYSQGGLLTLTMALISKL